MTAEHPMVEAKREFIEPGFYRDIDNDRYHSSFGWSSTQVKKLLDRTPAHLRHSIVTPSDAAATAQQALGSLVHTLVLEPDSYEQQYIISKKFDRRTTAGKEAAAEFEASVGDRQVIDQETFDKAAAMAESVLTHETAGLLLQQGIPESSVYWWYRTMEDGDDTRFKHMCKVRPDFLPAAYPVIMDLKTCANASYSEFQRSIMNFGYHISAAMYLEGVNQCRPLLEATGHFAYTKFVLVCVESVEPYLVACYELSSNFLEIGKVLYRRAMHTILSASEAGWPGYPAEVRVMEPPPWANRATIV